jgi:protease-4
MIGIGIGLIFVLSMIAGMISSLSSSKSSELESTLNVKILSNADGTRKSLVADSPLILQVSINGVIGGDSLNAQTVKTELLESREGDYKNNRVKAILLNINTPGGTVTDADSIYHYLKEYKARYKVPIYAYVDGLCASGGMYVALAADKIFATDISLIGSVGVITPPFMNFTQLMGKIGVESLTISAGKGKDELNPFRPWKEGEGDMLKQLIEYYYNHFVDLVVKNRPEMDKTKLIDVYGANVFPAQQAKEYGFIDIVTDSKSTVLELLVKEAGLEGAEYQVIELESKNWFGGLFHSRSSLLKGIIKHQIQLSPEFEPELANQFLYLYQPVLAYNRS